MQQFTPFCRSRSSFSPTCLHKEYAKSRHTISPIPARNVLPATPEDVLLQVVTCLRKPGDLSELAPFIPDHLMAPPGAPVMVAGVPVHEQGPLARCFPFMDTAARRILPGHLLRRFCILSSLQLGGSSVLRVALTACTGEEVVLTWRLGLSQLPGIQHQQHQQHEDQHQHQPHQEQSQQHGPQHEGRSDSPDVGGSIAHAVSSTVAGNFPDRNGNSCIGHDNNSDRGSTGPCDDNSCHGTGSSSGSSSSSSSSSYSSSSSSLLQKDGSSSKHSTSSSSLETDNSSSRKAAWQVLSCQRDTSQDGQSLAQGPHPRCSPELVVLAQLQALQNQELVTAAGFNMLGRHASGSAWDAHLAAFKHLLSQQHYSLLIAHNRAELGSSALPRQRHFLQEVLLWSNGGSSSGGSSPGRFLWRLGMQADGCWMVRSIEAL